MACVLYILWLDKTVCVAHSNFVKPINEHFLNGMWYHGEQKRSKEKITVDDIGKRHMLSLFKSHVQKKKQFRQRNIQFEI